MALLYHAADLLWSARLASTAEAAQLPAQAVRDADAARAAVEQLRKQRTKDPAAADLRALALVDLTSPRALPVIEALRRAREAAGADEAALRIVAFGPHVEQQTLRDALEAGADEALPRGALARRLDELLRQLRGD